MVISNRQRILAETGLLTLLVWMGVTLAIGEPPRQSTAGDVPMLIGPSASRAKTRTPEPSVTSEETPMDVIVPDPAVQPIVTRLNAMISEPAPELEVPTPAETVPDGAVIRMGGGMVNRPRKAPPLDCFVRDKNGYLRHGPMP